MTLIVIQFTLPLEFKYTVHLVVDFFKQIDFDTHKEFEIVLRSSSTLSDGESLISDLANSLATDMTEDLIDLMVHMNYSVCSASYL